MGAKLKAQSSKFKGNTKLQADTSGHGSDPGIAGILGCEVRGVPTPAIGPGGETPPELAGEDACGTGAVRGRAPRRLELAASLEL